LNTYWERVPVMAKKLTITVDDEVYAGLHDIIGVSAGF
jgi:hypothetical protein